MSGLDELTREELIALVIELHQTVEAQGARILELETTVQRQVERITQLEDEIARLSGPKAKPEWVKPNAAKKEKGPRKKRMQSYARQALAATQVLYHVVKECPECGRELSGGSLKWKRQVIDITCAILRYLPPRRQTRAHRVVMQFIHPPSWETPMGDQDKPPAVWTEDQCALADAVIRLPFIAVGND